MSTKIVFITGTDTGVGKTLLTGLLLCHLRARGARALALKPFCSGSRADAQLLYDLQDRELALDEVNPFYFPEPVAPLVSARKHKRRRIYLDQVLDHIHLIAARVGQLPGQLSASPLIKNSKLKTKNFLLIEGSGGLLVPLGEGYAVRDLISRLSCEVFVVSQNRLGTINHTLLTVEALRKLTPPSTRHTPKVVLMDSSSKDISCHSNANILSELLSPVALFRLPFFGPRACSRKSLKQNSRKAGNLLTRILSP